MATDLNKKTFFFISGASRGIGKTFAIECAKKFKPGSVIVLIARSLPGLEATKNEILKSQDPGKLKEKKSCPLRCTKEDNINKQGLTVLTYSVDLSSYTPNQYQKLLQKSLKDSSSAPSDFELAFIIHNAGTIGDVSTKAKDFNDVSKWDSYLRTNVSSVISLNSDFLKIFNEQQKIVVNITSKAAVEAYPCFAEYCAGKAARQMYFQVLAAEEKDILVLNYSPGTVDTDITNDVVKNSHDSGIAGMFENLRTDNIILTTEQTTAKFLEILEQNKFKSGDLVDYYD